MPTLGLKSVHEKLSRDDLSFANELGWLAAVSATVIALAAEIFA